MISFQTAVVRALIVLPLLVGTASAETLKVGPGQRFALPSQAFQIAKEGDTLEIDVKGNYGGDVGFLRADKLTVRGVGMGRAKIPAKGKHAGGKAIWVVADNDITIENVEFSGARVPDHNGAGIRAEGKNLTLRNCRFTDCEDGILGGAGEMLIEHCEFDHCGLVAEPATHSLYIGEKCSKLTFRFNYSTFTHQGHLLKSRAKENWILYNRLTDELGTGSAVVDLPNGGLAVLVGNVLQKGPKAQNTRVVAYGMEGIKHERNALYAVNNTMVYENHRSSSFFFRVENTPEGFTPVLRNNLCVGNIPLTNLAKVDAAGNLLVKSAAEAGFVDASKYDYHLKQDSRCVDQGVPPGKTDYVDLTPMFQYVHPAMSESRPTVRKLDIGAFEFGSIAHAAPMPLSDGKTFDGWEGDTTGTWRIVEGAFAGGSLEATVPRNEFLATKKSFTNFELRLKCKLAGTEGFVNGGIQFRSKRVANPPNEMSGYQADVGAGYWGCLYDEARRNRMLATADKEVVGKALRKDNWNDYVIRCEGSHIRLWLNGVMTVDYTEVEPGIGQSGRIAVQIHGGAKAVASYKDIVIVELP